MDLWRRTAFFLSVYNGLKNLRNEMVEVGLLMIHMNVVPFINDEIIDDAIRVAKEKGNFISENSYYLCMGFHDTDEFSGKSVLRETITGLNIHQTFYFGEILSLYKGMEQEGILEGLEPHTYF